MKLLTFFLLLGLTSSFSLTPLTTPKTSTQLNAKPDTTKVAAVALSALLVLAHPTSTPASSLPDFDTSITISGTNRRRGRLTHETWNTIVTVAIRRSSVAPLERRFRLRLPSFLTRRSLRSSQLVPVDVQAGDHLTVLHLVAPIDLLLVEVEVTGTEVEVVRL